ncbi:MAG TPA: hypothetical protein VGJ00_03665 [Rhabdochlamydiaceae bacterium]|jgi:hypothetical protein
MGLKIEDYLPQDLLCKCIVFTGSPHLTAPCNKAMLIASELSYREIVENYQRDPRLARIVVRYIPKRDLGNEHYAFMEQQTRKKVKRLAKGLDFPVPHPREVQLQGLMTVLESVNFKAAIKA